MNLKKNIFRFVSGAWPHASRGLLAAALLSGAALFAAPQKAFAIVPHGYDFNLMIKEYRSHVMAEEETKARAQREREAEEAARRAAEIEEARRAEAAAIQEEADFIENNPVAARAVQRALNNSEESINKAGRYFLIWRHISGGDSFCRRAGCGCA